MIRQEIKNLLEKAIKELKKAKNLPKFEIFEIQIESPEEKIHGDYATNAAMIIAKIVKKDPMETASLVTESLSHLVTKPLFDRVEVAPPGFVNFFLSKEYLQKQVEEILKQGEKFGQLKIGKNKKTQIEFISANPTGLLHIGHGRGAFYGDILANVLEKSGYKTVCEYYINDAKNSAQIKGLGRTALGKGTTYLNEYLKAKILNLKPKLEKISDEGNAGHFLAREVQKDIKNFIEKKLKIKFDSWVSEEDLYKKNKVEKIYQWLKNKNLVYEKEKAQWILTSRFGDEKDWVVVRESGEPTYLLSDIAYHKDKFDRGFQKIINIWGADHQGHVGKMKAVAKILDHKGSLDILISQVVRLKGGAKLSKRKGQIIALEELIDEVGLDVARFFYLTKSLNTQMEFDLDLAKQQSEKNPVFYIQYAHARICAILRKCGKSKIHWMRSRLSEGLHPKSENLKLLKHPSESKLIKQLIRFPEIIEDTAKDYQVQRIPQYALDLATSFHQFYRNCKVMTEDKSLAQARLGLVFATKIALKNTLDLMGISAPEKM